MRTGVPSNTLPLGLTCSSEGAHTCHKEAVKKLTASRKGAKAQRKASSNSFNFFAGLCGFAPLREIFWLGAHLFTPSRRNVCATRENRAAELSGILSLELTSPWQIGSERPPTSRRASRRRP